MDVGEWWTEFRRGRTTPDGASRRLRRRVPSALLVVLLLLASVAGTSGGASAGAAAPVAIDHPLEQRVTDLSTNGTHLTVHATVVARGDVDALSLAASQPDWLTVERETVSATSFAGAGPRRFELVYTVDRAAFDTESRALFRPFVLARLARDGDEFAPRFDRAYAMGTSLAPVADDRPGDARTVAFGDDRYTMSAYTTDSGTALTVLTSGTERTYHAEIANYVNTFQHWYDLSAGDPSHLTVVLTPPDEGLGPDTDLLGRAFGSSGPGSVVWVDRSALRAGRGRRQTIVAHEYAHIEQATDGRGMRWSSEGVAEYLGVEFRYRYGRPTPDRPFSAAVTTRRYAGESLVGRARMDAIMYGKGSNIAALVDHRVRRASNGRLGLADVYRRSRTGGRIHAPAFERAYERVVGEPLRLRGLRNGSLATHDLPRRELPADHGARPWERHPLVERGPSDPSTAAGASVGSDAILGVLAEVLAAVVRPLLDVLQLHAEPLAQRPAVVR